MLQVPFVFCSFCFLLDQTDDTFKLSTWWEGLMLHLVYASLPWQVLSGDSLGARTWPRGDGVRVRSGHTLAQWFAAGLGSQARLTAGKALLVLPCPCLAPWGHPLTGAGGRDVLVACAELGCSRPVLLNVGRSGGLRAPSRGQTSLLFEACCPPEEWVCLQAGCLLLVPWSHSVITPVYSPTVGFVPSSTWSSWKLWDNSAECQGHVDPAKGCCRKCGGLNQTAGIIFLQEYRTRGLFWAPRPAPWLTLLSYIV